MKTLSYKTLYITWAALFALTAVLGFVFPDAAGAGRIVLALTAAVFFVPPWLILNRAKGEKKAHHIRLLRWLCVGSLVLTAVLLVLNLRSAGLGPALGQALNAALIIVSAPMVCSNFFALPIFLWGCLLADTFRKT